MSSALIPLIRCLPDLLGTPQFLQVDPIMLAAKLLFAHPLNFRLRPSFSFYRRNTAADLRTNFFSFRAAYWELPSLFNVVARSDWAALS
jgi:hypothetical protein